VYNGERGRSDTTSFFVNFVNFVNCEFCELKKLTLSALFYGKRGKLNHSVSSVFSLVVEREYKTIVVWLVPVDGVLG
jgi:hypothetical protein